MSMVNFFRKRATEKGIQTCPHCGEEDILFGLGGKCLECGQPIPRNDKYLSLEFAIESFTEFFVKYDKIFSPAQKANPIKFLLQLCKDYSLLDPIPNSKIIQLQSIVKNVGRIGGEEIGGVIVMTNGNPTLQVAKNFNGMHGDPIDNMKSLGGVIVAMQYILSYPVKNEFVIDTVFPAVAKGKTRSEPTPAKGGCLKRTATFFLVLLLLSIIIYFV